MRPGLCLIPCFPFVTTGAALAGKNCSYEQLATKYGRLSINKCEGVDDDNYLFIVYCGHKNNWIYKPREN